MAPIDFCNSVDVAILFFLVLVTMIFLLGVKWKPIKKFGNKQRPLKKIAIFHFFGVISKNLSKI